MNRKSLTVMAALLAGGLIVASPLAATGGARDRDDRFCFVDDDGERLTLSLDGSRITIVGEDGYDGRERTVEIDLAHVGDIVRDAMDEVELAMAELEDLQLDIRLGGRENSLLFFDGEEDHFLDIDELVGDIAGSIAEAFADVDWEAEFDFDDLDRDDRHMRHVRRERSSEREELESTIADLQAEIADLEQQLRRLRQRDRH